MSKENSYDGASDTTSEKTKRRGAPSGNMNAWKHGKYSSRRDIILTCRTCVAKSQCEKYDESKPCFYEKVQKPDLGDVGKLADFLRHLIELDYLRLRRCYHFEVLQGGLIDADAFKLGRHIRNEIYTLARLTELSDIEKRLERLEQKLEVMV